MKLFSDNKTGIVRRYPPTLLERLQDEEPKSAHDRLKPVDTKVMRSIVQKDITDLINHSNMEEKLHENRHAYVRDSVLNFGISALIGSQENRQNWSVIEQKIRKAILCFEPRIIPETLVIRSLQNSDTIARYAIINIEIRGLIYWHPRPIDLCMSGRYDFESEKVDLKLQ